MNTLDHYLDDFIFVGRSGSQDCVTLMFQFESLASKMGVPLAEEKTTRPTTRHTYLGFEIDTVDMTIIINENS